MLTLALVGAAALIGSPWLAGFATGWLRARTLDAQRHARNTHTSSDPDS
jgi:hypothetical protein